MDNKRALVSFIASIIFNIIILIDVFFDIGSFFSGHM